MSVNKKGFTISVCSTNVMLSNEVGFLFLFSTTINHQMLLHYLTRMAMDQRQSNAVGKLLDLIETFWFMNLDC